MATRKSKPVSKVVVKRALDTTVTLTIAVLKPRNRVAMNPLLKKSAAHTDALSRDQRKRGNALEVQQAVQDALNRRRGGDTGGNEGGDGG